MDRAAPEVAEALITTKRCADCAYRVAAQAGFEFDRCGRSIKVEYHTGIEGHFTCAAERSSSLEGDCGPKAIHFIPTTEAERAKVTLKFRRKLALEQVIYDTNWDADDAAELIAAVVGSIKRQERYEDKVVDVEEQAKALQEALEDIL